MRERDAGPLRLCSRAQGAGALIPARNMVNSIRTIIVVNTASDIPLLISDSLRASVSGPGVCGPSLRLIFDDGVRFDIPQMSDFFLAHLG